MVVISMIVMYEDDSVEVRYIDGWSLQLSPCGSEFLLEKPAPLSAHPLQPSEKIRQRTRFVTSAHKEIIVHALEFRNRYAARPYLPKELIPPDCRMHYFTDISEIEWPPSSSCGFNFGSNGEAVISSVDGHASLLLSSSKEEFLVEFLCRASQTDVQGAVSQKPEIKPVSQHLKSQIGSAKEVLHLQEATAGTTRKSGTKENGPKSTKAEAKEAHMYTRVVQHHSCSCPPSFWRYPLSLALDLWDSQQRRPSEYAVEEGAGSPANSPVESLARGEKCHLLEALPLTCPTPHQHRWNFRDSAQRSEQDLEQGMRTELVKVLSCQGIVYRLINGAITIIEISPGDGSVIRSNGAVANYFTHYTARLAFGQENEEKRYFVNSLPPDVPGQAYSLCSVITRASRILKCYNQARLSLKLSNSQCCWREEKGISMDFSFLAPSDKEISRKNTKRNNTLGWAFREMVHILNDLPPGSPDEEGFPDVFNELPPLQDSGSLESSVLIREARVAGSGHFMAFSDGRVHVVFLDGVTLQMMWNLNTSTPAQGADRTFQSPGEIQQPCGWCQLVLPDGQRQLLQLQAPGSYSRYVSAAVQWSQWVEETILNSREASCEILSTDPGQSWSVVAELEKIKRFNFLLEHSGLLKVSERSAGSTRGLQDAFHSNSGMDFPVVNENSIAEALQKTAKAIQDIETLLSVTTSTNDSTA